MAIVLGKGKVNRDWTVLISSAVETVAQALVLGKDGFSAAISSFFRFAEGLRGEDDTELRATRLIIETLTYAAAGTIALSKLGRLPHEAEIETVIKHIVSRAQTLLTQLTPELEVAHIANPARFSIFQDASEQIWHELKLCNPKETQENITARFQRLIVEGMNRTRARNPQYFFQVFELLSGPEALADSRWRAWEKYRELLVRRFEDEPLFGESEKTGVRLGQVYQPLRAWWDDEDSMGEVPSAELQPSQPVRRNLAMLDDTISSWLASADKSDRVRLISGGPGSGKSTFAKQIAAKLASEPRWRVLLVPLQRLRGTGPLETRIDEYFRMQGDEPFDADTAPLQTLGRDGHQEWVIIFDGLDELAKEGSGSESAAQDFASSLADWKGRIALASVHFIVLGRAPSMQEARRRLGLHGPGTVFVLDMVPVAWRESYGGRKIIVSDPGDLQKLDQRAEFWSKCAVAKGKATALPKAMNARELDDLTKEPLLAYLLIFSGYVGERWKDAAENRNRIYQAIFDQIWIREKSKPTRMQLNDLGQDGFEAIMQTLGLAAWRGGGRTGDEATFISVRDIFIRPDLLIKAKSCGAADLSNVALLFYTRKDEESGRGYEFLHKSFGEYLTARGLFSAFRRWGEQVENPSLDFDHREFLWRWLRLAGAAPMSLEIRNFLHNEVRLQSGATKSNEWLTSRKWVRLAAELLDVAVKEGLPAFDGATTWRSAETQQNNAELSLVCLLDACARAAYPDESFGVDADSGGWTAGPVKVPSFQNDEQAFVSLLMRLSNASPNNHFFALRFGSFGQGGLVYKSLSRLSLAGCPLHGRAFIDADFSGASFDATGLIGATFVLCDFDNANLGADLREAVFLSSRLRNADLRNALLEGAQMDDETIRTIEGGKKPKVVSRIKAGQVKHGFPRVRWG